VAIKPPPIIVTRSRVKIGGWKAKPPTIRRERIIIAIKNVVPAAK